MTIDDLTTKWLRVISADARWGNGEPAAPVAPLWREVLRATIFARATRRVLIAKGVITAAEWDTAIGVEADALDAALTARFGS